MTEKVLILSQDYELFFGRSGSAEKCLFEPCDALLVEARRHGYKITFYVDIGMIIAMEREAAVNSRLSRLAAKIGRHIESLARDGHEIGLHIHPHWEETKWQEGAWDFSGTRYQLGEFSDDEIEALVPAYAAKLGELAGSAPKTFRAGGFCIEPFDRLGPSLSKVGIFVDSSVVPGMRIQDGDKGVDFRVAPTAEAWRFSMSPLQADLEGQFVEIPIGSQMLPLSYYWKRLVARFLGRGNSRAYGDGSSKRLGYDEVMRRLLGMSRRAELSVDTPKSEQLARAARNIGSRRLWQIMGHPKLLSESSFGDLNSFVTQGNFDTFATIHEAAELDFGAFCAGQARPTS